MPPFGSFIHGPGLPLAEHNLGLLQATLTVIAHNLIAAHEDIESGRWQLMPGASQIDDGEFYAQMKAPKRERDMATGMLRYRWSDTGALDHYRHAQAFDFLGSEYVIPYMSLV